MAIVPLTCEIIRGFITNDPTSIVIEFLTGYGAMSNYKAVSLGVYEHIATMKQYTEKLIRIACEHDQLPIAELIIELSQQTLRKRRLGKSRSIAINLANNGLNAAAFTGNIKIATRMIELGAINFDYALRFAHCSNSENSDMIEFLRAKGGRLDERNIYLIGDYLEGWFRRKSFWVSKIWW
jgi:hypothetical protein